MSNINFQQENVHWRLELGDHRSYVIAHTHSPHLSWRETDQVVLESLKDYFSQFGEVSECTVMRDSTTGRSRGFGFLTFRDPKTVNTVMVKEHYLDGKIVSLKISFFGNLFDIS